MHEEAHSLISLVILVRFHFLAEDGLDDLLTKNLWVQRFPCAQIFHIRYMLGWAIWNFCYSATLTYKDGDFLWFSLAKTCSHFLGRTTMVRPQLQRDRGSPNLSQIPLSLLARVRAPSASMKDIDRGRGGGMWRGSRIFWRSLRMKFLSFSPPILFIVVNYTECEICHLIHS